MLKRQIQEGKTDRMIEKEGGREGEREGGRERDVVLYKDLLTYLVQKKRTYESTYLSIYLSIYPYLYLQGVPNSMTSIKSLITK